jgi:selenocysteine lyase/cysteine desulfurase
MPLLAESDRVKVLTPLAGDKSGAICLFNVEGLDYLKLSQWLWGKYKIVNTPILHPEFNGIRITPNVYTTPQEIDTFTDVVRKAIKGGITV